MMLPAEWGTWLSVFGLPLRVQSLNANLMIDVGLEYELQGEGAWQAACVGRDKFPKCLCIGI